MDDLPEGWKRLNYTNGELFCLVRTGASYSGIYARVKNVGVGVPVWRLTRARLPGGQLGIHRDVGYFDTAEAAMIAYEMLHADI